MPNRRVNLGRQAAFSLLSRRGSATLRVMIEEAQVRRLQELAREARGNKSGQKQPLDAVFRAIHDYRSDPTFANLDDIWVAFLCKMPEDKPSRESYKGMKAYLKNLIEDEKQWVAIFETKRKLEQNSFHTDSGLDNFKRAFPYDFEDYLSSLGSNQRWLDAGAGQAKPMIEYLEKGGRAYCLACSYRIPEGAEENVKAAQAKYGDRFVYIAGKYFSEFTDIELQVVAQKFDLITDVNGVLYYTHTFQGDLKRYLQILNIGGKIFFTKPVGLNLVPASGDLCPVGVNALGAWLANIGEVAVKGIRSNHSFIVTKQGANNKFPATVQTKFMREPGVNSPTVTLECSTKLVLEAVWV